MAAMLAAPAVGFAQPAGRSPKRVAICSPSITSDEIRAQRQAFAKEFAKHGVIDGRDIEIVILRAKSLGIDDAAACDRQSHFAPT